MNYVRHRIGCQLFAALHEANLADADGDNQNDLPSDCASSYDLFGHLKAAIISLGYTAEFDQYVEQGEIPACMRDPRASRPLKLTTIHRQ